LAAAIAAKIARAKVSSMHIRSLLSVALLVGLAILSATFAPKDASADWFVAGAEVSCNTAEQTFEILPLDDTSEGIPSPDTGFRKLPKGPTLLRCKLGKYNLLAKIDVIEGQARGACMGPGLVNVDSLSVGDVEVLKGGQSLDWSCPNSDAVAIVALRVRPDANGLLVERCEGEYAAYEQTRKETTCHCEVFDVAKLAAEYAKIDHDLASLAEQRAHVATSLPTRYDLAAVFDRQRDPWGQPICVHWVGDFFSLPREKQAWGRVSGKVGERAPIFRANPQRCSRQAEDGCKSTAYVVAGDRVDVGLVCGAWSFIRYRPRVQAFPQTVGWMATSRLYGVTDLSEPRPRSTEAPTNEPRWQEPLIQAILRNDVQGVKQAIAAGSDPDGADKSGFPLSAALCRQNDAVLEGLLSAGAHIDLGGGPGNQRLANALMTEAGTSRQDFYTHFGFGAPVQDPVRYVHFLLQHGASINARDKAGATPLFYAIGANNIDVVAVLLEAHADPNAARDVNDPVAASDGAAAGYTPLQVAVGSYAGYADASIVRYLLDHGADPNFQTGDYDPDRSKFAGETALTYAARMGYPTIVATLLEHGADPTKPRGDGAVPADIAADAGHKNIAKLLRKASAKSP
jgi:ankyrin repeat protein